MPTLLIFGPRLSDGNRDSYVVEEDFEAVAAAMETDSQFVRLTDGSDGAPVMFRKTAIRYFWAH